MKMIFYSHASETHFQKKRFVLLVHSNRESVNRFLITTGFCSLVFGSAHAIVLGLYILSTPQRSLNVVGRMGRKRASSHRPPRAFYPAGASAAK